MSKPEICDKFFWHVRSKFRRQADAAKHYGCSVAFVSAVSTGKKMPNQKMLADLGFTKLKVYIGDTPEQIGIGMLVDGKVWTADRLAKLESELKEAKSIIREIASYGMDSTDKEIADEALRVSRAWVANQPV